MLGHSYLSRYGLYIPVSIWFVACLLALLFAFVQRDIHDADIAFAYFMIFLTFPIGYVLAAGAGVVLSYLYDAYGIVAPAGFVPNLLAWLLFVVFGFLQWFILLPWLLRKFRGA